MNAPMPSFTSVSAATAAEMAAAAAAAAPLRRRTLLAWLPVPAALLLPGCGFRLRGVQQFAFGTLYLAAPPASPLARELRRTLQGAADTVQVLTDPAQKAQAEAILEVLAEQRERSVVGLNASGQVRELQLRLRLRFRLVTPSGEEWIPETELLQQRDISYNETIALAKEAEEALLYRNMQTDLVQQLLRRLAAVKKG